MFGYGSRLEEVEWLCGQYKRLGGDLEKRVESLEQRLATLEQRGPAKDEEKREQVVENGQDPFGKIERFVRSEFEATTIMAPKVEDGMKSYLSGQRDAFDQVYELIKETKDID